ncbi:prolyl oligopeptidase family protein [Novosphingobium sp. Gsoil 351]|uniref:prolyl oligopeptidase family serine peptidase n=1 Tax=Novosphingobium sp. Gsoil 351 TaxID=2675225 RepID=UPI0012B46EF8|nr:prolyl oligopeptidase family serine peptidase [Novosphingobium sp. Gsoil 351]QGN54314.1 prolyl oligopeptidase family serine peptidase [Novosphingobium sp. Gsoil 351]
MFQLVRWLAGAVAAATLVAVPLSADTLPQGVAVPRPNYPSTRRDNVIETAFGERVADPYRWLENDVRRDPAVADWVRRQNAVSRDYLDRLPGRDGFAASIRRLLDYERFGIPKKAGGRYFFTRNSGLQNQFVLYWRKGFDGVSKLLLDPNLWSQDGTAALDQWEPSRKGTYLAFSVQDGGSDWRTVRFADVAGGLTLPDELRGVKYSGLAWLGDEGLLYSRFPQGETDPDYLSPNSGHAVWFHRLGTPQSADQLVYASADHPERNHFAQVTADGRWAVISTSEGTALRRDIHVIDLRRRADRGWQSRELVGDFTHDWRLVDGLGTRLWFVTDAAAPRYRLVSIDLAQPSPQWREVVPQTLDKLEAANVVGDRLILSYLKDAATRAVILDLHGRPARAIVLNGIGTAAGFDGRPGDPESFYSFSSFNRPASVYRLDMASGRTTPFAVPRLGFDPVDYAIEQRFYESKDGTRVPLFVIRNRRAAAAKQPLPTILYGYGGFDVSLVPGFSAVRMAWLEAGGAFAIANVRGGGEYGREWHAAGSGANKQNTFDDFIAAGEYLIAQGITPRDGLAIQGGSNGGLLVGAVINQRPGLFAAANPDVGVMDMLRFDRFTAGRYWTEDYGSPAREADWRVLRAYSPYHNIRKADYPAVLVTTADTDDRVVPAHSFKYVAALQAAELGNKPRLIRVETRAGHGSGKPTDKVIESGADVLAFMAYWTGLTRAGSQSTPASLVHSSPK